MTNSEVESIDFATFDTGTVTGSWRFEAAYAHSPGEVSGLTARIVKGRNPTSDYLGMPQCDITVQSADSDYQALRLPGLNGKHFNPCAFVGAIIQVIPPNGQSTVRKQFGIGGYIEVYYNGNSFRGFKTSSQMGNMTLAVNGSGAGAANYGIPGAGASPRAASPGAGNPVGANGRGYGLASTDDEASVIPAEPELMH
jgi:hypothetical protein